MGLTAGECIGEYEIAAFLGAGGMGEVYRARDRQLGRDVALKVLPALFTSDPDRLARFEREARLLATLNHPNIGAIYGLEQADGVRALVLELVEGHTLDERLRTGPVPVRDALTIACQIAQALEAAHEKGIVHRDLKPANVAITHAGVVKVLDFGLAKTTIEDLTVDQSNSPTVTSDQTRHGVILGTVAYMSPEQARGGAVDKRTDIWAFGCVLYELLTRHSAFAGDTVSDTLVAILDREPAWQRLPAATPANVRRLLRRCLDKNPKRRLHDIADARIEIEDALEAPSSLAPGHERPSRLASLVLWTAGGLLAGGLMSLVGVRSLTPPTPADIIRFPIALPANVTLGFGMALSPDGRTLVYSGNDGSSARLFKRSLDALESVPIRGSEGGSRPFFSPDGASVGFLAQRAIKRIPLAGGVATTVVEGAVGGGAATWLSDASIVFGSEGRGLMQVPATGGQAQRVTALDDAQGELEHTWPVALPNGGGVLFTVHYGAQDSQRVHVVSPESGKRASLVQGNGARFLLTGHIVFQRGGSLWIAPLDRQRLELTAPPQVVIEGVAIGPDWGPIVAVGGGTLAYATGGVEPFPPRLLVWVDKQGREERIDAPPRNWWWPQVAPDGKRLGFHIMDPGNMDAWIYELDHGPLIRMTYSTHQDGYPVWSPDGKHIAFWSRQAGGMAELYVRSADLRGSERRLTTHTEFGYRCPFDWADGGKLIVFQDEYTATGMDISVVPIDGSAPSRLVIHGPFDEARPAMSRDGRWIAYQSNSSGRWEVYVQPFPDLGGRWQVSSQGGVAPIWSPDGRELFYRAGRAVMSVPVDTTGTTFKYANSRVLFEGGYVPEGDAASDARSYALSPDGRRFLMMKEKDGHEGEARTRQIVLIANWVEELRRRFPVR